MPSDIFKVGNPLAIEVALQGRFRADPNLPAITASSKPDSVFEHPERPDEACVIGSHKTAKSESDSVFDAIARSWDTILQALLWNSEGPKVIPNWKPCEGVYLNFTIKTKEVKFRRIWVPRRNDLEVHTIKALQWFWHVMAAGPRVRSFDCLGGYFTLCKYHDMCMDCDFPANKIAENAISDEEVIRIADGFGFLPYPWDERPTKPSEFGNSRYKVLKQCPMKHYLEYTLELVPEEYRGVTRAGGPLAIGSAFHMLLARHYRGHADAEELAMWPRLNQAAHEEAHRLYDAYGNKFGDKVHMHDEFPVIPNEE